MFNRSRKSRTMQFGHLNAEHGDDHDGPPNSLGSYAADAAVMAIGTAVGVGAVTLVQHLVADGASALFGGISAGGAFSV